MSKEILTAVGNLLMGGVEFHSRMVDYYSFLNLPCFRESQCKHLEEELHNYHEFLAYVCDKHKTLLKYTYTSPGEVIPHEFYSKSMMEIDENSVKAFLKTGVKNHLAWEVKAKAKLEECAKELLEHHCHADYHYVCCLIDDVITEIYHLENLILDLKMVSYEYERVPHLHHKLEV